jgi:hypothetical protein
MHSGAPARRSRDLIAFAVIAAAAIAARLPFLLRADRFFDADEAVEGLMARHVLLGEHPLFLWGQRYKGVPEVYLSSLVFRAAGPGVVALKAVTLACFVVFLLLNFTLVDRLFSRRIAWMATAFFIAGPPSLVLWTLSGSAEIVMTLLCGAVILLGIVSWLRTGSRRGQLVAAAALGFGLWVHSYVLYYVVSLVVTAAVVRPNWKEIAMGAVRGLPAWLRGVVALLSGIGGLYVVLGLIPFLVPGGAIVSIGSVRIAVTSPQKMWWVAGACFAAAFALVVIAVRGRQLVAPALAFLAGYAPAIVGRFGNNGLGAPIYRLDVAGLIAAWPDMTGLMLPMLLGFRDPLARRTVATPLVLALLALIVVSYVSIGRRRTLTPYFHVFPIVAIVMFVASGSYIDPQSYRYLMPLYAALPVIYAVGVDAVWQSSAATGTVVLVFTLMLFGAQQLGWYQHLEPDTESPAIIACLDRAGVRTARAGYWQSYKITFLTGERIIVSPSDGMDRYASYSEQAKSEAASIDVASCFSPVRAR